MQISNYELIVVHKKNNIIHILNISEIMHSEPHFSDGNILEHKIKALEINSTQFYSQMKVILNKLFSPYLPKILNLNSI